MKQISLKLRPLKQTLWWSLYFIQVSAEKQEQFLNESRQVEKIMTACLRVCLFSLPCDVAFMTFDTYLCFHFDGRYWALSRQVQDTKTFRNHHVMHATDFSALPSAFKCTWICEEHRIRLIEYLVPSYSLWCVFCWDKRNGNVTV